MASSTPRGSMNFGGRGSMGGFSFFPPAIKFLLISNIGIYLVELLFGNFHFHNGLTLVDSIDRYGALWPLDSGLFYPWQIFTYMFLHQGFTHVAFNMLALWMFGAEVENTWGTRKFSLYYILCGLGGAAAHLILSSVLTGETGPLVGASGAIFGLLVAYGLMFPDRYILFYFIVPIKAKYFVAGYIALELYSVVGATDNISHLAHLGGAVTGIIFLIATTGGNVLRNRNRARTGPGMGAWGGENGTPGRTNGRRASGMSSPGGFFKRPQQPGRGSVDAEYYDIDNAHPTQKSTTAEVKEARVITQEEIDRILDKIAATGYQNLTDDERSILFEASKRMEERR